MSELFLTAEEIVTLTGYTQKSRQSVWLKTHKWRYETNRFGTPNVARDYANQRMGSVRENVSTRPEWGNLRVAKKVA